MRKIKNSKGFTLMEMLIVVAIIAILVAIAIPTFTSQLEKARQAADLANIRSAYAEAMVDALTSDTGAGSSKTNIVMTKSESSFDTVTPPDYLTNAEGWSDVAFATKGAKFRVSIGADGKVTFTSVRSSS